MTIGWIFLQYDRGFVLELSLRRFTCQPSNFSTSRTWPMMFPIISDLRLTRLLLSAMVRPDVTTPVAAPVPAPADVEV